MSVGKNCLMQCIFVRRHSLSLSHCPPVEAKQAGKSLIDTFPLDNRERVLYMSS